MKFTFRHILYGVICCVSLSSCFTGIEGTKKITLSKSDLKAVEPTAEEKFLASVTPSLYTDWIPGKRFFVADSRASVMLERRGGVAADSLRRGDILLFRESGTVTAPDGREMTSLIFEKDSVAYQFAPFDRQPGMAIKSTDIPALIDLDMVERVARLMRGRKLWTRSQAWTDSAGRRIPGRKFTEVTVTDVAPGSMVFPLAVDFVDDAGVEARYMMNFGNSGKESRSFANLFALSDPRHSHGGISDHVWANVQRGEVEIGMTKEECRLSKGNPSEVNTGRNYSHALLLWSYPDATVLYFEDDILTGINTYGADGVRY